MEKEERLYHLVTRVNIACGGHAGDEASMGTCVGLAMKTGVLIGAHPSYEDRANFGRVSREISAEAIAKGRLRD